MKKGLSILLAVSLLFSFASVVAAEEFTEQIPVQPGDPWLPIQLEPGMTIGQSFTAETPFDYIMIFAPTWQQTDSGFTFTLKASGPDGEVIFTQKVENAVDGSSEFRIDVQPAGTYYAEMSEPVGQIGWWTKEGNPYDDGSAYTNGEATADHDRVFVLRLYDQGAAAGDAEPTLEPVDEVAEEAPANPQTGDAGMTVFVVIAVLAALALAGTRMVQLRRQA